MNLAGGDGKCPARGAGTGGDLGRENIIRTEAAFRWPSLTCFQHVRARDRSMGRACGEFNSFSVAPWSLCKRSSNLPSRSLPFRRRSRKGKGRRTVWSVTVPGWYDRLLLENFRQSAVLSDIDMPISKNHGSRRVRSQTKQSKGLVHSRNNA